MNEEKDNPKRPEAAWETDERERRELEDQWKQPPHDPSKPQKATKLKGGTE